MNMNLDKSTWKRVVFGDVIANINDFFKSDVDGVLPYVAGPHINSGEATVAGYGSTDDAQFPPTFKRKFQPNDVLLHSRGIGKLASVDRSGVTGEKLFVLRTKNENCLLQSFLIWVLQSPGAQKHMRDNFTGSVNKFLNWKPLAAMELHLPPLDEQKRIANLLWAVERHRRGVVDEIEGLYVAQSRWLEKALVTGVSDHGWVVRPVPELVTAGPTNGKSATANDEERGVPTLSISAIRNGQVLGGAAVKYIDVSSKDVEKFVIEVDDFLVVRGNGNKKLTGRGGLAADTLPEGCVYPDLLIRLRFDADKVLPAFAAMQWNSGWAHDALIKKAKSTNGIWKINGKDIKSHRLIVPPVHEQQSLLTELGTFQDAAASVHAQAGALRALRSSILADIFGGN